MSDIAPESAPEFAPDDPFAVDVYAEDTAETVDPDDQLRAVEEDLDRYPDEADLIVQDEEGPQPLGRGWMFDPDVGFVRGVAGRGVVRTDDLTTLKVWIIKTLRTQRGVHPIYDDDYGMADPVGMIGGPTVDAAIGEYEQMIADALAYHPRIAGIQDYAASPLPTQDGVIVAFTVVLDDESEIALSDLELPV